MHQHNSHNSNFPFLLPFDQQVPTHQKNTTVVQFKTQMSQHQQQPFQECSEIHTIQVFREADMMMERQHPPITTTTESRITPVMTTTMTFDSIPYHTAELYKSKTPSDAFDDGIGGDWAIEEDAMLEAPPPTTERRGSDSTLYSFYFETPLVTMVGSTAAGVPLQQQPNMDVDNEVDDFTITSQDSESFHNTSDLQLDDFEDSTLFWEIGLSTSQPTNQQPFLPLPPPAQRCLSPAHVSLHGEEYPHQPYEQQMFARQGS
jgi:hypothetical protein